MKTFDVLDRAKRKGQAALLELPRTPNKENPKRLLARELVKQRSEKVKNEARIYRYAFKHHELCPPVGTVLYIQSPYGLKAKLTVKWVLGGLPATVFELLPLDEQPEHLRDEALLAKHTKGCGRSGWVGWSDYHAWEVYQRLLGRSVKPWEDSEEPLEEMSELLREAREKFEVSNKLIGAINRVINSKCLTPGQLFTALVDSGDIQDTHNDYNMFLYHLTKARAIGQVDNSRIAEGRGHKQYKGGGVRNKFNLGDKVRIKKLNGRTPNWLIKELRLDTPRTITLVCNVIREIGFVPRTRHTLYYLGSNQMGSDNLEPHGFRSGELIPYIKGDAGRPKLKRHYNRNPMCINGILPVERINA